MLGNPVNQAYIRPPGSPLILGNFRVTVTFLEHIAAGRGPGIDFGNGQCGADILAVADGVVDFVGQINGANTIRIRHDQLKPYFGGLSVESGYAHLATMLVKNGQIVRRGQKIGTLGKTGATACHLHFGFKVGGIERDSWPLLDQNEEEEMLKGTAPVRLVNQKASVIGNSTRFRAEPNTVAPVLAEFVAGMIVMPDFIVTGQAIAGSDARWYGVWAVTAKGIEFGYVHVSLLGPLSPVQAPGFTQAQLDAAKAAGATQGADAVLEAAKAAGKTYGAS